jgi:hypothetical protein
MTASVAIVPDARGHAIDSTTGVAAVPAPSPAGPAAGLVDGLLARLAAAVFGHVTVRPNEAASSAPDRAVTTRCIVDAITGRPDPRITRWVRFESHHD